MHSFGLPALNTSRLHHQQDDPAHQGQRAGDRWNEVAVRGFHVQTEEIDRLARSREGDARVGEHHDAQRDQ